MRSGFWWGCAAGNQGCKARHRSIPALTALEERLTPTNTAPYVQAPVADISVNPGAFAQSFNLAQVFADADPLNSKVGIVTSEGTVEVELFDRAAPATVANFLRYVQADRYDNTIVHRSVPGFVVQAGGYRYVSTDTGLALPHIDTYPTVVNEFSPTRSNLRGTIAMAKLGSDPNSATSEFFFNLGNNSSNLDNQNGGFTVFAQVISQGMNVVDGIAGLQYYDAGSPFDTIPLKNITQSQTQILVQNLITINDVAIRSLGEQVSYSVVSNSNPNVVTPAIVNGSLNFAFSATAQGRSTVVVRATDRAGATVDMPVNLRVGNLVPVIQAPTTTSFVVNQSKVLSGLSVSDADGLPADILNLTATVTAGTLKQGTATAKSLSFSGTQAAINTWLAGLNYQSATDSVVTDTLALRITETGISEPLTATKNVALAPLRNSVTKVTDPLATSKVALMIQGTDGADAIWVRPSGTSTTTYLVTMGSVTQTVAGITGRVVVFGFAGNDSINLASARIATRVDAGDGNDIVQGGSAADIIFGGNGADLLIGGLGADTISGDAGNDILVDGTVALTQAGDTLTRVLTTWSSVAVPTTTIYNNITARLRMTADTAARDTLKGLAGSDWFWSAVSQNTGVLADILDAPVEKRRTV